MDVLILGGTVFLGRHVTQSALASGHRVTHFNRGQSRPGLVEGVETIHGDRDGGLDALGDRRWDAVIDTCGYVPRIVRQSAERLADRVGHYTFVSSISVYLDMSGTNPESLEVATLHDPSVEEITPETYGPLKAACERVVAEVYAGRSVSVRAGLIVGPDDPTDRFAYWPRRMRDGGRVVAPAREDAWVQFIDVRDISDWIVRAAERGVAGPYNVTGPEEPLSMRTFLKRCRRVVNPDAELVWVSDDVLLEREVEPWTGLPLWIPDLEMVTDCARARAVGLPLRPLEQTVRDTLAWLPEREREDDAFAATLSREQEAEILGSR